MKWIYVISKCGVIPKLFYRYISRNLEHMKDMVQIRDENGVYRGPKEIITRLPNLSFSKVFESNLRLNHHREK